MIMNIRIFDKKRIALLLIALMAVLYALGCKHTTTPINTTPSVTPGVSNKATPTPVPPTATPLPTPTPIVDMSHFRVSAEDITRTPEEEGEKTVPVPEAWGKLNPFYSTEPTDCEIVDQTQLRLFDVKDDGGIRTGLAFPCGAYRVEKTESGITVEGSDKTYDKYAIVLKQGLTFADGTPVTADDVLFSIYTLSDKDYKGIRGLGDLNILGMREYHTQVPRSVRDEAARAIAAGLTEEGTCPEDFADKQLWSDVWINYDVAGVAFVEDMVASVMNKYNLDAYVQAFLSPYLTAAHVQASPSLQVLFTMKMFGYVRSYNYSKNTMRDCFDVVHELNSEELTPELFWGLIKEYYGYNLSVENGINYERAYDDKLLEDYIAEAYCEQHLGVESIEGVNVSEAAFGQDAPRPCIEVTIASDAKINDFNFYVVEKSVYEKNPARCDVLTGAGRYTLVSNDENGALLEANDNYLLGVEKQKYVRYIVEVPEEETEDGAAE